MVLIDRLVPPTLCELRRAGALDEESGDHLPNRQIAHGRLGKSGFCEPARQLFGRTHIDDAANPTQPCAAAHIGQCSPAVKTVV